jgi:hypothetical protein
MTTAELPALYNKYQAPKYTIRASSLTFYTNHSNEDLFFEGVYGVTLKIKNCLRA